MPFKHFYSPTPSNTSFVCTPITKINELEIDIDETTLIVFDIDEVLITTEDHFSHPYAEKVFLTQMQHAFDNATSDQEREEIEQKLSLCILSPKRILIEEESPALINSLQQRGAKVIGLTMCLTGSLGHISHIERWRLEHLRSLNINFTQSFSGIKHCILDNLKDHKKHTPLFEEGILFSPGYNKGDVLKEFLHHINFKPSKVIFIDDLIGHLESVESALHSVNIPCRAYQYMGAKPFFKPINTQVLEYQFKHLLNKGEWLSDKKVCQHFSKNPSYFIPENTQKQRLFQAHEDQLFHLSIGAVLFDRNGCIACHHFTEIFGYKDVYILMRESMENEETPLMTLHRGLKEEFGASAKPIAFLGSISGNITDSSLSFEKTTLYIACELINWCPENRDLNDPEAGSMIEWLEPSTLITLMEQQRVRFQRIDADESEIIKRALPFIQKSLQIN